jgi:hypothetical protein
MMTSEAPEGTSSANGKNRWFQLGLVSAGAAAPLIARWRSLRAAEQAEALREQASARWNNAMERVVSSLPQEAIQETLRQALPQAQESLRQVGSAARTALQRLPAVNLSTPEPVIVPAPRSNRRVNTTLWLVGVSVGVVAAGAVAYVMLRNRISAASDDDTLVEIPLTAVMANDTLAAAQADAASAANDGPAIVEEPADEEPGIAEPLQFSEDDAEGAAFVGNILSRVYHPANSKRLPTPEHRIYFTSEEEATEAGYRPDGAEIASRASDAPGDHE